MSHECWAFNERLRFLHQMARSAPKARERGFCEIHPRERKKCVRERVAKGFGERPCDQNKITRGFQHSSTEPMVPTCANMCHYVPSLCNIAVCQLGRDRQPLRKSHGGLNLTCLDQCHGVRFHGTSSSQAWRKRIAIQSTV